MSNELNVRVEGGAAGTLVGEDQQFVFSYAPDASPDQFVSLTMPVRFRDYVHPRLHPVFEMHLPEGYLLSVIKKQFAKLTETDDFGVLSLLAPSIRGRVHYGVADSGLPDDLELDHLLYGNNDGLFEELVQRFALRSALSGVQPKVLARVENKATLKLEDYIVKSSGAEYPALALNEYCCMLALKNAGIPVPEFYLSEDESLFIMKRFDLTQEGLPMGFEDMCVLQAKSRDDKYSGSYEQVAKTIKTFVNPRFKAESLRQFFKMVVMNNRLQNGDGHLKNFGLIYENVASVRLAPAYDVVSTTAYIRHDVAALTLMGSKKWWNRKHLLRFGIQVCDLTAGQAERLFDECEAGLSELKVYVQRRLKGPLNEDQRNVLAHLDELLGSDPKTFDAAKCPGV
ncbi:type II toxin-antitoxin system HipA family toxin [Marinobacter sp. ATCH36]|uniref:type II toxin-antitoxin system HipA family toxin n=1 Tax=Marinobacter sp. ATCH36 TaxID=2945106 RepID=UPI002021ED4A|nr:type II toxin-antitoxin system HipA family toxin [Marinobacter sp. ATCH36]MCL7945081.1 type II toxin-antitoxin system HipA family toxin [Marinobacter sp. ATCH36]